MLQSAGSTGKVDQTHCVIGTGNSFISNKLLLLPHIRSSAGEIIILHNSTSAKSDQGTSWKSKLDIDNTTFGWANQIGNPIQSDVQVLNNKQNTWNLAMDLGIGQVTYYRATK